MDKQLSFLGVTDLLKATICTPFWKCANGGWMNQVLRIATCPVDRDITPIRIYGYYLLQGLSADLITMAGNVAQVFVTDEEWMTTLRTCRNALRPHGRLVFETRNPDKEVWKGLNREQAYTTVEAPAIGTVESWVDWANVQLPLVSFRSIYVFHKDGSTMTSESTLRFRIQIEGCTFSEKPFEMESLLPQYIYFGAAPPNPISFPSGSRYVILRTPPV